MEPQKTSAPTEEIKNPPKKRKLHKKVSYSKYGYLFLIPFFVIFVIFQAIPLGQTFYYSVFKYYMDGLDIVGPNYVGFDNFKYILVDSPFWRYLGNTLIIWIIGFVPQMIVSLLLAVWFTDSRLKLHGAKFFKAVTYMPNLVMASAFGMMFLLIFGQNGPINQMLLSAGLIKEPYVFMSFAWWVRLIICFINWLMWFGNTAILLMSGIMGIDESIFESARLDGAGAFRAFRSITMPLLMPIFVYVFITSMIGGLQLYDAAYVFTQTTGGPNLTSMTIMMYLSQLISVSKNYGDAGALSVILFIITGILSIVVFKTLVPNYKAAKAEAKSYHKRQRYLKSIQIHPAKLVKDLDGNGGD